MNGNKSSDVKVKKNNVLILDLKSSSMIRSVIKNNITVSNTIRNIHTNAAPLIP
jgi:hypothetical protein